MLLLYEYRTTKNSCITYYEPCLNEFFKVTGITFASSTLNRL